jgi:hypothetical protein
MKSIVFFANQNEMCRIEQMSDDHIGESLCIDRLFFVGRIDVLLVDAEVIQSTRLFRHHVESTQSRRISQTEDRLLPRRIDRLNTTLSQRNRLEDPCRRTIDQQSVLIGVETHQTSFLLMFIRDSEGHVEARMMGSRTTRSRLTGQTRGFRWRTNRKRKRTSFKKREREETRVTERRRIVCETKSRSILWVLSISLLV